MKWLEVIILRLNNFHCINENINLDKYLEFRELVKRHMEFPEWLGDLSKEDFIHLLKKGAKIWIYYFNEEPICSMMVIPLDKEEFLSFGVNVKYDMAIDYGPIFVNPKYFGNGLQYQMLQVLDQYCLANNYKYVVCTIHPNNIYSKNNLIKNDFIYISTKNFKRGIRNIYFKKLSKD